MEECNKHETEVQMDTHQDFEDKQRLLESLEDFENGRTIPANIVIQELRDQASVT
jgi:hypothetical protein